MRSSTHSGYPHCIIAVGRTANASPVAACSFTFHAAFVILDGGTVLRLVGTDPGFVILNEAWRRRPEY
jgi:hypothetical protein